jgi:hypothetical protein
MHDERVLAMLQPSLHSGLERFALGRGRSADLFCIISELCVAALSQHCSVGHVVFTYVASCRQQYGICSPACIHV